jgi:hypothetical protein
MLRKIASVAGLLLPLSLSAHTGTAPAAESVLGIPCTTGDDGVRSCIGDGAATRVRTWDGIPLDVDVLLPPASTRGPYPTIVYLHGFGGAKGGAEPELARRGYALVQYSARGFGQSCGLVASRGDAACARGWSHLADVRYEPRDTQHLLGRLADAGITYPRRIGVTGTSYGAGQSLMLATLRDRVAMPDGTLVPWRSPKGTPMELAAAAPNWPWSDLASMLVPEGSTLDYAKDNPYGPRIGVPKLSYVGLLAGAGGAANFFAPPQADFGSDAIAWIAAFAVGEPYGDLQTRVIDEIRTRHSALGINRARKPAPVFANASWPDDLTTPTEIFRWRNVVLSRWPRAEVDVLLSDGAGHPRAAISGTTPGLAELQHAFWDRHLRGALGERLGIRTFTHACNGAKVQGPFSTPTWEAQHPGEVRFRDATARTVTSAGDPAGGLATDPVANTATGSCVTTRDADAPGVATYRLPAAPRSGWTVMGSPTVVARIGASGEATQLAARLWDVAPGGSRTLMARLSYRPRLDDDRPQVFQLHPVGWHVAAGHVLQLELLGADQPYVRASNGAFILHVSGLELRIPVREAPGTRPGVEAPAAPLARDGSPLPAAARFVEQPPAAARRCVARRKVTVSARGLRRVRATLNGRRIAVRRGRVVVDLRKRRAGRYVIRVRGRTKTGRSVTRTRVIRTCPRRGA